MACRYFGLSTFVATAIEIGRTVGGLFSKYQRFDRKEAKRHQKEGAALLHRFKTQDADRARATAALVAAGRPKAEARALAMRRQQEEEGGTIVAGNKKLKLKSAPGTSRTHENPVR